jgi:uncharacterized protein (TIGR04255 family)
MDKDEFDEPLGGLTGLGRIRLEKTHMEAAVAEVRFLGGPTRPDLPEAEAVRVWEGMGPAELPVFEPQTLNMVSLSVTPAGPEPTHQMQQGWILANADRSVSLSLFPSVVALQLTAYERYSTSLGDPLARALALFVEVTGVSVVQRLGLRYINRLHDPGASSPEFWAAHVRPEFAGPLVGDLAPRVAVLHQEVQVRLDEFSSARMHSGVFREQSPVERYSFLVDLDVFREQAMEFDAIHCSNLTRQLNRTALALFARVLSEEYLDLMGPAVIDEEAR